MRKLIDFVPEVLWTALIAWTAVLLIAHSAQGQTTRPAPPSFVVGVWAQPVAFMDRWKERGVNTLFGAANDTDKATWEAAAAARGMFFITYAGADPNAEAKQPYRLGFLQPDEPDMPSHLNLAGSKIEDLRATYTKLQPLGLPVWMNLLGSAFDNVYYDGTPKPGKTDASLWGHRAATNGYMAQADVIGFDYHLWTSGRPGAFEITKRLMDRCNDWSGGKPIFAYVETCTQGTNKPFTADDYEAQVNTITGYAKEKGYKLKGIVYFATAVQGRGSWPARFDVTSQDVAGRMIEVHRRNGWIQPTTQPGTTLADVIVIVNEQSKQIAALRLAVERQSAILESVFRVPTTQGSN